MVFFYFNMSSIITLSGSNSTKSINTMLLDYIVTTIHSNKASRLSLLSYDIPMYNLDLEQERGIPVDVQIIKNKIAEADGVIIAVNEHNGMISAFFKNIFDWLSRADRNFLAGKKLLVVSTSPGARGAASALNYIKETAPRFGGEVVESFSFPSFQDNFDVTQSSITNSDLEMGISQVVASFLQALD